MYEFHFEAISPLPVILTFYFLSEGKKFHALLFALLAILCKENIPLVICGIGAYGVLFLKGRRILGTAIFLLSAASFFIITLKLQPMFTGNKIGYASHYASYGNDFSGIFSFLASHPFKIVEDIFSTELKRSFFVKMFSPLLFLPLLRLDILLVIAPMVAKNLLSSVPTTYEISWHYTATMIPFMIISLIYAVKTIERISAVKRYVVPLLFLVICMEISCSIKFYKEAYTFFCSVQPANYKDTHRNIAVSKISKKSSVISTFDFLPRLSMREKLLAFYTVWRNYYRKDISTDFAIVDFNDYFIRKDIPAYPEKISGLLSDYLSGKDWKTVYAAGDIAVFSKIHDASDKTEQLISISREAETTSSPAILTLDNSLELIKYYSSPVENNIMPLTFVWRVSSRPKTFYDMFFVISDGANEQVFDRHPVAYWYDLSSVKGDLIVKETYRLLLPPNLAPGNYTITAVFGDVLRQKKAGITIHDKIMFNEKEQLVLGTYSGYTD